VLGIGVRLRESVGDEGLESDGEAGGLYGELATDVGSSSGDSCGDASIRGSTNPPAQSALISTLSNFSGNVPLHSSCELYGLPRTELVALALLATAEFKLLCVVPDPGPSNSQTDVAGEALGVER